jgi:hypothetical protein
VTTLGGCPGLALCSHRYAMASNPPSPPLGRPCRVGCTGLLVGDGEGKLQRELAAASAAAGKGQPQGHAGSTAAPREILPRGGRAGLGATCTGDGKGHGGTRGCLLDGRRRHLPHIGLNHRWECRLPAPLPSGWRLKEKLTCGAHTSVSEVRICRGPFCPNKVICIQIRYDQWAYIAGRCRKWRELGRRRIAMANFKICEL